MFNSFLFLISLLTWLGGIASPALLVGSKKLGQRLFPNYVKQGQMGVCGLAFILFSVFAYFHLIRPDILLPRLEHRIIFIDNHPFGVEVAQSEASKERGLMGRTNLLERQGMLFVWQQPQHQEFWMKDTLIPLDILFFNNKGMLIGLSSQTPICVQDPCPIYDGNTKEKSQFVVELKSGIAEKYGFKVGQTQLKIESKP